MAKNQRNPSDIGTLVVLTSRSFRFGVAPAEKRVVQKWHSSFKRLQGDDN